MLTRNKCLTVLQDLPACSKNKPYDIGSNSKPPRDFGNITEKYLFSASFFTNSRGNRVQIIDPKIEKQTVYDKLEDCLEFHINECIKQKYDSVTFQNHQREGSGTITENCHGNKR